ncbi:FecR family protein [Brevundimonas sp. 2YAF1]|uniref:FecR family protein n=1 Tax=Brevundimonas sp. 2YAF1 TaxID=3233024 RepID=UPI003F9319D1
MTRRSHMQGAEAAAQWLLLQEAGSGPSDDRRLAAWLDEDDDHIRELAAVRNACDALDRHGGEDELLAMRQAALAARAERRPYTHGWVRLAAGIGVLAIGGALAWGAMTTFSPSRAISSGSISAQAVRYATAVGERSTATLPDGSVVALNTATVLEVDYSDRERAVRLLAGQAQFDVAHGSPLPFRVYAQGQVITATGTLFDVFVKPDEVRVALIEGRVLVKNERPQGRSASTPEVLAPGEVLVAQVGAPVSVRPGDVRQLSQWREGLVAFNDTPLSEAVAEINRYTNRPIQLADPEVGRLRVSGSFRVAEPERFAHTMAEVFLLDVNSSDIGLVLSSKTKM